MIRSDFHEYFPSEGVLDEVRVIVSTMLPGFLSEGELVILPTDDEDGEFVYHEYKVIKRRLVVVDSAITLVNYIVTKAPGDPIDDPQTPFML